MTEGELGGWHLQFNGDKFEQTLGDGERQGSLACCTPSGHKETDTTEQLNNNKSRSRIETASLVAQLIKNLPPMQETLVRFLGHEDPLKKG